MCKLVVLVLVAAACLTQAHGAPRDLEADMAAAVESTDTLIVDTSSLIDEENAFYTVVASDVFLVLQDVIAQLATYGVPQEQLDMLLTNLSNAHLRIQSSVNDQVVVAMELIDLLNTILADLATNPYNLGNDSWYLVEQRNKMNYYFINATINVSNEMNRIKNNIADLILELTMEQAGEIEAQMVVADAMINVQYVRAQDAKAIVDLGIAILKAQLENIVIQLPQPARTQAEKIVV